MSEHLPRCRKHAGRHIISSRPNLRPQKHLGSPPGRFHGSCLSPAKPGGAPVAAGRQPRIRGHPPPSRAKVLTDTELSTAARLPFSLLRAVWTKRTSETAHGRSQRPAIEFSQSRAASRHPVHERTEISALTNKNLISGQSRQLRDRMCSPSPSRATSGVINPAGTPRSRCQ